MNYQSIYDQIIQRARSENRKKSKERYFENHHIIPKCLGGSNEKLNLVLLTAREHYVCHKLLVEIYPDNKSLIYSVWMFASRFTSSNQDRYKTISSKEYERYKTLISKQISESYRGVNHPNYGKPISDLQKAQISKVHKGKKLSEDHKLKFGQCHAGKIRSNDFRQKISEIMRNQSDETKRKRAECHIGSTRSKEAKVKMSESWINRPMIVCPHCNKESKGRSNMRRHHFDNCKNKLSETK